MFLKKKRKAKDTYDLSGYTPVIRCSICTGLFIVFLLSGFTRISHASFHPASMEDGTGFADAVSSATGKIENWIEFYPTYGILVVILPQKDGYRWEMVVDETDAIKAVRSGVVNHVWYAGLKATASDAITKVRFQLLKNGNVAEARYIDLRIQDTKISGIIDYGAEKQTDFVTVK